MYVYMYVYKDTDKGKFFFNFVINFLFYVFLDFGFVLAGYTLRIIQISYGSVI
jgi:uncharacterized Tic20 family protein